MEIVQYLNAKQKEFLQALEGLGGSVRAAASQSGVSLATLEHWKDDPDFRLAVDSAMEAGRGLLEANAMIGLHANLSAGKMEAVKLTLQAVDPEMWNPAQRIEWEPPAHRFIGFDGKDVHTGEVYDGEFEDVSAEEAEAGHLPESALREEEGERPAAEE